MLLDALLKAIPDCTARVDEGRTDILTGCPIGHQRECGLPWFTLHAEKVIFIDLIALDLQSGRRASVAIFAVTTLRNHALKANVIYQMEDSFGVSGQRLAELNAVIRQYDAF